MEIQEMQKSFRIVDGQKATTWGKLEVMKVDSFQKLLFALADAGVPDLDRRAISLIVVGKNDQRSAVLGEKLKNRVLVKVFLGKLKTATRLRQKIGKKPTKYHEQHHEHRPADEPLPPAKVAWSVLHIPY